MEGIYRDSRAVTASMTLGNDQSDAVKNRHDETTKNGIIRIEIEWEDFVSVVFDSCRRYFFSFHSYEGNNGSFL